MKPAPCSQSGPIATPQGCWLWLLECIIFFLFPTSSSHLDPAATPHSTLQGSSAVTPEHPSVIDPLMEQDEGPGSPPAKQSTPSSRSASAMLWDSICPSAPLGQTPHRAYLFSFILLPLRSLLVLLSFCLSFSYSVSRHSTFINQEGPRSLLSSDNVEVRLGTLAGVLSGSAERGRQGCALWQVCTLPKESSVRRRRGSLGACVSLT